CKWPSPPRSPYASTGCVRRRRRLRLFSKTHGPNVIRRFHGASAPTLRVHQHPAPRQYRQPRPLGVGGAPTAPALVHQHRSRRPHEPPADRSRSPGGQPAPETPGCTSYACPTYRHPSRGTSSPTSQVSTIRGQPHFPRSVDKVVSRQFLLHEPLIDEDRAGAGDQVGLARAAYHPAPTLHIQKVLPQG